MTGPLERIIFAALLFIVFGVPFLTLLVVGTVLLIQKLRSEYHDDVPANEDDTTERRA